MFYFIFIQIFGIFLAFNGQKTSFGHEFHNFILWSLIGNTSKNNFHMSNEANYQFRFRPIRKQDGKFSNNFKKKNLRKNNFICLLRFPFYSDIQELPKSRPPYYYYWVLRNFECIQVFSFGALRANSDKRIKKSLN